MLEADTVAFPTILPLPTTKLAAACSEDGSIHVFYQAKDGSIRELVFDLAQSWFNGEQNENGEVGRVVVGSEEAKPGTPLAVVAGGWMELRLFYVDKANLLKELYSNDRTDWIASESSSFSRVLFSLLFHPSKNDSPLRIESISRLICRLWRLTLGEIPSYNVDPTAMLTAVAWNHASAYYQIRLFSTTNSDDLREFSFSRNDGGWDPEPSVRAVVPESFPGPEAPLSAVSAVVLEGEWKPKVYYHPKRPIIAEWDVCAKTPVYAGVTKVSAKAIESRKIEEETRVKIQEEEEKKRLEEERIKQEEEEAKRQEEERARQEKEEERVRKEEEEKKRQEELQRQKSVPQGGTLKISDPGKAAKLQAYSECTQGFEWKKESGGWRCAAGGHFISDADFDAL